MVLPTCLRVLVPMVGLAMVPALASGTEDCPSPPRTWRAMVCADAGLRDLDARLRDLEHQVAALGARPASLSQRARAWRAERAAADLEAADAREDLHDAYAERIAALEEQAQQDRALRQLEPRARRGAALPRPAALERRCLGAALRDCRVSAAGVVIGKDRTDRILWQMQEGVTTTGRMRAGIVLFAALPGGWRLLGWSFEAHDYAAPRLLPHAEGLLLHVRGIAGGTGAANADLLYRLGQDGWSEIETESWRATLRHHLPADLDLRHRVAFDFAEMTGTAQLWHSDDAECCPRGGMVTLDFAIQGPGLVLTGLTRSPR
jgi:uncharacterized protein